LIGNTLTRVLVPESVFSGRTGRSTTTDLSWTFIAESTTSQAKIVQPLSATSFITRSTEITASPRESVIEAEQIATVVHISATGPPHGAPHPGPELCVAFNNQNFVADRLGAFHGGFLSLAYSSPASLALPDSFSVDATITAAKPATKGGTLHLTILDPSPMSDTLGPN